MGKKDKNRHATPEAAPLSKKERKALEARAIELETELERKAAKKAAKREKDASAAPTSKVDRDALKPKDAEPAAGDATHTPAQIIAVADKVLRDPNASEGALTSARKARAKALEGLSVEDMKERLATKRARREELEATASDIDRADDEAVKVYNAELADLGGGLFLTGDAEKANVDTELKARLNAGASGTGSGSDIIKARRDAVGDEPDPAPEPADEARETRRAAAQVAEVVQTETGREFAVGSEQPDVDAVEFGKPSDAPRQLESGARGYKIMTLDANGKPNPKIVRQFTRVTTYIDNLEDKTNLETWKMRTLLEGVMLNDTNENSSELVVARVADLVHRRDVALAKARKADRKGKLAIGELAALEYDATKAFKDALDAIARDALDIGGVHEKANKGTNLHALCEEYDADGMEPINAKLRAGDITPADHADIVSYAEAMLAAGVRVLESEIVVVNDALKYAGRLDRTALVKLPGSQRAVRLVLDIKTGRVDYGAAKIAQQLSMYANAQGYDLETGERRDLRLDKRRGLLVHLPAGKADCRIYVVDLTLGGKGNKLSGEVRAWRNEGKKAVDFAVDLSMREQSTEADDAETKSAAS